MVKKVATLSTFIFFLLVTGAFAQNIVQSRPYPKNFFRYPLDIPPVTAGSFGELRPNHFHSGLDFKTNQRTGYPVHAAADGYISRLRVEFGGFGNAIYITHPNGYTTVYGHIERFGPEMEKIVRAAQYQQQREFVDIPLQPLQIQVCQGDVIAWSGNAGASEGPHLHFEVRDAKTEEAINPQLFGLTIPDKIPPSIYSIAVYHLGNQPFSEKTPRLFLPALGSNGSYHLVKPQVISVSGQTGFGITSNDLTSVSPNHNGIYSVELKVDGKTIYTFTVERFAFNQTHAINAYIDYPEFLIHRLWMQKCFILPGSKISLYPQSNFTGDSLHHVQYVVKDVAGNTSLLNLDVRSTPSPATIDPVPANLFRYDRPNQFNSDKVKVMIAAGNLFDNLDFTCTPSPKRPGMYSPVYSICNHFTPINDTFDLWIKPDSSIGKYANKAVIVNADGICENSVYQDGYVKTQPRTFGDYFIKVDTVPPVITPLNIKNGAQLQKANRINLRIGDRLSGVKDFSGKIDGKWVLTEWDFKTHVLSYTFDNSITPGRHQFDLTVTDNKDNVARYTAGFVR
jgi:hypothetical protein